MTSFSRQATKERTGNSSYFEWRSAGMDQELFQEHLASMVRTGAYYIDLADNYIGCDAINKFTHADSSRIGLSYLNTLNVRHNYFKRNTLVHFICSILQGPCIARYCSIIKNSTGTGVLAHSKKPINIVFYEPPFQQPTHYRVPTIVSDLPVTAEDFPIIYDTIKRSFLSDTALPIDTEHRQPILDMIDVHWSKEPVACEAPITELRKKGVLTPNVVAAKESYWNPRAHTQPVESAFPKCPE